MKVHNAEFNNSHSSINMAQMDGAYGKQGRDETFTRVCQRDRGTDKKDNIKMDFKEIACLRIAFSAAIL
jgi:hypothetical protein